MTYYKESGDGRMCANCGVRLGLHLMGSTRKGADFSVDMFRCPEVSGTPASPVSTGMKIVAASHLDHGLTAAHLSYILNRFADRNAFFLETVELPYPLPSVPCGLHGPAMGDAPIPDTEVTLRVRDRRMGPTRTCARPFRETRLLTVIAGPHEGDPCVLYTAYGGPPAPREPWDESQGPEDLAKAQVFWAEHALSERVGV